MTISITNKYMQNDGELEIIFGSAEIVTVFVREHDHDTSAHLGVDKTEFYSMCKAYCAAYETQKITKNE